MTRQWNIAYDQSNANYDIGNKIIYSTEALKYNISDYNHAYKLARGDIAIVAAGNAQETQVAL